VAFFEVQTIDPLGRTSVPEMLSNLTGRFSFSKAPQGLAEMDIQKGIELGAGKLDDINIDRMALHSNGIIIDTRSGTDDAEKVLSELLKFTKEAFGAMINPTRKNFVSQIVFRSDLKLTLLNPVLEPITAQLSEFVSGELKQPVVYEPIGLVIGPDSSQTHLQPVNFSIERRAERPFFENTYFSSAPLRTAEHLKLVNEFEEAMKA